MSNSEVAIILGYPFGLSLFLLLAIWRPWRKGKPLASWALPVVVALAYPTGRWAISSLPSFPPPTADEWLVFFAVATGFWGAVQSRFPALPYLAKQVASLGFISLLFWLMAYSRIAPGTYLVLVLGVFTATLLVDRAARLIAAPVLLWSMTAVAAASSPILLMGSSFRLALLAATLSAITAAAATLTTFSFEGRRLDLTPFVLFFCLLLAGLFVSGVRFADAPLGSALIIAASLTAPFIFIKNTRAGKNTRAVWLWTGLRLTAVLLIASLAVGYTYWDRQFSRSASPTSGDAEEVSDYDDPYSW